MSSLSCACMHACMHAYFRLGEYVHVSRRIHKCKVVVLRLSMLTTSLLYICIYVNSWACIHAKRYTLIHKKVSRKGARTQITCSDQATARMQHAFSIPMAHIHIHAYKYTSTLLCTYICIYVRIYIYIYIYIHTHTNKHTYHTHTYTHAQT